MSARSVLALASLGLLGFSSLAPWRSLPPMSEDPTRAMVGIFPPWRHLDSTMWQVGPIDIYKAYPLALCAIATACIVFSHRVRGRSTLNAVGVSASCLAVVQLAVACIDVAGDDIWRATMALFLSAVAAASILGCSLHRDGRQGTDQLARPA